MMFLNIDFSAAFEANFYSPSYDKGPEFADGDIGVSVGAARFGNASAELGVAEGGEQTGEAGEYERQDDTGTGGVADNRACKRDDKIAEI